MTLKYRLNLSHVMGFFAGVFFTVIFNWFVFKDPKRVTAPGVAALIAACTFTLALWSAFKVNRWVNAKVNEKGFRKCEEILDDISRGITKLLRVNLYATKIFHLNSQDSTLSEHDLMKAQSYNENYINEADEMDLLLLDVVALQHQLKTWGFIIDEKHNTLRLYELFVKYRENVSIAFDIINEADPNKHHDYTKIKNDISDIYQKMIAYNRGIFSTNFENIFKEASPPSKNTNHC